MKKVLSKILQERYRLDIKNFNIENVVMDSRKVEKNSLFFAINNGNNFIDEILEKEVGLIIADNYSKSNPKVIKVKNTVDELQKLANEYRKSLDIKVVAITGSNGKTSTKDIISQLLSMKYKTIKTQGNYNNHIGLPFTILQLEDDDEIAVLEMGMSDFKEIDRLCEIAKPDIGIITNIGDSHLEYLKTRENVFKAKSEMVPYIDNQKLILFGDDVYLNRLEGKKVGFDKKNDFVISNVKYKSDKSCFQINEDGYEIPLNGEHNVINSSLAIVVAQIMGVEIDRIKEGLEKIQLTQMRFQKVIVDETIFINDAYNASPISMRYALETFDKLYNDSKKIVVLGDMLELGENEIRYHQEVIEIALNKNIDEIILFGPRMKKAMEKFSSPKIKYFEMKEEIRRILELEKVKKAVLLKGSRGMRLEEILGEKR